MKRYNNLLNKYLKAGTSIEEEKELKKQILSETEESSEKIMTGFFEKERMIPARLEDELFEKIIENQRNKKKIQFLIYSLTSVAASLAIIVSIFLNFRNEKNLKMESDFALMETALLRVSESIQPNHPDDMLVLWVDDNVEIIIK